MIPNNLQNSKMTTKRNLPPESRSYKQNLALWRPRYTPIFMGWEPITDLVMCNRQWFGMCLSMGMLHAETYATDSTVLRTGVWTHPLRPGWLSARDHCVALSDLQNSALQYLITWQFLSRYRPQGCMIQPRGMFSTTKISINRSVAFQKKVIL